MKLRLINAAKSDLKDIRIYTRREFGAQQVTEYMGLLRTGLNTLRHNPDIGYPVDHIRNGFRCWQVEYHRIFYRIADDHIIVFAILHESQLPIRHLSQRRSCD